MGILRAAFSTWYVGMIVALLLFVPAIKAFTFAVLSLAWVMRALQALMTGSSMPSFWG